MPIWRRYPSPVPSCYWSLVPPYTLLNIRNVLSQETCPAKPLPHSCADEAKNFFLTNKMQPN